MTTAEHDAVNHPRHYTSHGLEDLHKARFYLEDQCRELGPFDGSMPGTAIILLNLVATSEAEIHGSDHWRPQFFRAACLGDIAAALAVVDSYLESGQYRESKS